MAKKILVYSVTFYPHQGGMEKNSELLAQTLNNFKDLSVTLITNSELNNNLELNTNYKIIRTKSNFKFLKHTIINDIIIINGGVSLPAVLAGTIFGKKIIPIFQMAEIPGKPSNESKFKAKIKKKLLKFCDKVVGVSQACLESRKISSTKGLVIYNPIDPFLEDFKRKNKIIPLKNRPIDILYAGRMIEGKGIFILIDALKQLDLKKIELNVLFSGNGSDEDKLKNYVSSIDWQYIKISFQDYVRGSELAQTYLKAKCMILPSHSHTEGSPLSIAEAFSFGCAIIHSNQPAMIEQTGKAGISFLSGDHYQLSKSIEILFKKSDWQNISKNSVERSKLFSSENYQMKLKEMIASI